MDGLKGLHGESRDSYALSSDEGSIGESSGWYSTVAIALHIHVQKQTLHDIVMISTRAFYSI